MPIPRKVNKDFFKTWTPEMAYVLGFFAADGTMVKNNRGAHFIEFHITDRELLEDIKKALGSNHKIATRKRNDGWKLGFRLQIGSKEMFADLSHLGFHQNKSNSMTFPDVPKKYQGHFVRGYFDGDGNIYFKKHVVKGRKNPKWIFSSSFTSGSKAFLLSLHNLLKEVGVKGGFVTERKGRCDLVLSHRDSLALFRFMYNNASSQLFLERKYKKFCNAIETLYKDEGV